LYRSNTI